MDFSTENDTLSRISKALYGDALTLAVMEAERLNAVLDDLDGLPAKEIWLADVGQFDRFFDLLEATKRTFDVRNASLAMLKLMDLAEEAIANHKPEQATEGAA